MSRRLQDKTRREEGRGLGTGADYVPWHKLGEFRNSGTSSIIIDYKTGRQVYVMSRGELYWWHYFRWQDDVEEIREQYPLALSKTVKIADELGYNHPKDVRLKKIKVMTTDFLIIKTDGTKMAVSVKPDRKSLDKKRTMEKLLIEKTYWEALGVSFCVVYKSDLDMILIHNIIDVTAMYSASRVQDRIGLIRHLIARKEIYVDMSKPLNYREIAKEYEDEYR